MEIMGLREGNPELLKGRGGDSPIFISAFRGPPGGHPLTGKRHPGNKRDDLPGNYILPAIPPSGESAPQERLLLEKYPQAGTKRFGYPNNKICHVEIVGKMMCYMLIIWF